MLTRYGTRVPFRMRKRPCPYCGKVRWIRWWWAQEYLEEKGEWPPCRECMDLAEDKKGGTPYRTGNGPKQIPCPACGKVRWVPRRNAANLCLACKMAKKRATEPPKPPKRAGPGRPPKKKIPERARRYNVVEAAWAAFRDGKGYVYWRVYRKCGACGFKAPESDDFFGAYPTLRDADRDICLKCFTPWPTPEFGDPIWRPLETVR